MIDIDMIEQREQVFGEFRHKLKEISELDQQVTELNALTAAKRGELHEKKEQLSNISSLIEIMLRLDCCPVEAKLRHAEDLEKNNNIVAADDDEVSIIPRKGYYSIGSAHTLVKSIYK